MDKISDYLSRSDAIADFEKCNQEHPVWAPQRVKTLLMRAPSADVKTVVHCRDCKHWHEDIGWCDIHSHFQSSNGEFCHPWESSDWKMFPPDYFCADGERGIRFKEDKK